MPNLELNVLGPLEATLDERPLDLGGPRLRALLALLALSPRVAVAQHRLVDELWSAEPSEAATTTLRSYVSRLRRTLGEGLIRTTTAGYVLEIDGEVIDAVRFERLVRQGDLALQQRSMARSVRLLGEALAVWRGEPFDGLTTVRALASEADRLNDLRLDATEHLYDARLALGEASALVGELEGLVAEHPYRERLWAQLMLALYRSGRQADALAAYHQARRTLADELGIEPGPELQQLELAILRQEVTPASPIEDRHNLPAPLSSFVGRTKEVGELGALLQHYRLVTLTGVGGVGKTRLAIEVARNSLAEFADGAWFIDLVAVHDADALVEQLATLLDVRQQGSRPRLQTVAERYRDASLLLVLDNCEHVREASAGVAASLLAACPRLTILATSRIPLGAPGEVDFAVSPLEVPRLGARPDELEHSSAVTLLLDRARAARPRLAHDDDVLADAARICRDLDGLPLAIELAAARAKALTLADIAARLEDRFRFLVSWRRVAPARHQTLKQAIDWSFDLLEAAEQQLLPKLAVFAGGFDLDAVAAICLGGDAHAALDSVSRLVDASLVSADDRQRGARFTILETVRQYAGQRLAESGHEDSVRRSHADYYLDLARRAEPLLIGDAQTDWLARLDADHDNLRGALDYAERAGDAETLLAATIALTRFWYVRGYLAEARDRLARALERAGAVEPTLRRRALTAAAAAALLQGDHATSIAHAEASLGVAREIGQPLMIANGLSNLGAIKLAAGAHDEAGRLLRDAVALAREVGDTRILALALNNLGDHALTVGDYATGEPLFRESLDLLRARGDTANVARSLFNLGAVSLQLGRVDEAQQLFTSSLEQSRTAGDREDLCWDMLGLAGVAAAREQSERAGILLGAAAGLLDAMGATFKPYERQLHERTYAQVTTLAGRDLLEQWRARGAAMTLDEAVALAAA